MGTLTSWTLSDGTSTISVSGNDSTVTIPSLTDDASRVLTGTITLEVGDGTDTATDTFTLTVPSGYSSVNLTSGFATDNTTYLYEYGGTPAVGDEFIWEDVQGGETLTLNADGSWETTGDGTFNFYGIDATDGYMESDSLLAGPLDTVDNRLLQQKRLKLNQMNTISGVTVNPQETR